MLSLKKYIESQKVEKTLTHIDAVPDNFMILEGKGKAAPKVMLIDWEYAGYGDPGFDIGSYVCGGEHSGEDVDRILFTYFINN